MNTELVGVRPWRADDAVGVRNLLAVDADLLWVSQFHSLHGANHSDSWDRTLVALHESTIVGAVSAVASAIHPARLPCAIDVHPCFRRQGIGKALLHHVSRQCPRGIPFMTKAHSADRSAMGFLDAVGARAYQKCPGISVDPGIVSMRNWCACRATHGGFSATSLEEVSSRVLENAFIDLYTWTHEDLSQVGSRDALELSARREVADLDRLSSSVMWCDEKLLAAVFAFAAADGTVEIVAETVSRDVERGCDLLGVAISRTLRQCASAGIRRVEFDGHVTDPHLHSTLLSIPERRDKPLLLVEIPQVRGSV